MIKKVNDSEQISRLVLRGYSPSPTASWNWADSTC